MVATQEVLSGVQPHVLGGDVGQDAVVGAQCPGRDPGHHRRVLAVQRIEQLPGGGVVGAGGGLLRVRSGTSRCGLVGSPLVRERSPR